MLSLEPFSNLSVETLNESIRQFRRSNQSEIPDEKVIDRLLEVFTDKNNSNGFAFPTTPGRFEQGQSFYRVRCVQPNETIVPFKNFSKLEDAWEPPASIVQKRGRLNLVGQPVLYTCPDDPILAINEARVVDGEYCCVIKYKASKAIETSLIGAEIDLTKYRIDTAKKVELFHDFLETEFTRDVADGLEHLYRLSHAIADTFYHRPNQDAWVYRSVVDRKKPNCAFISGRAKSCLDLVGAMIVKHNIQKLDALEVKLVVGFAEGRAHYFKLGTVEQLELFPELQV